MSEQRNFGCQQVGSINFVSIVVQPRTHGICHCCHGRVNTAEAWIKVPRNGEESEISGGSGDYDTGHAAIQVFAHGESDEIVRFISKAQLWNSLLRRRSQVRNFTISSKYCTLDFFWHASRLDLSQTRFRFPRVLNVHLIHNRFRQGFVAGQNVERHRFCDLCDTATDDRNVHHWKYSNVAM